MPRLRAQTDDSAERIKSLDWPAKAKRRRPPQISDSAPTSGDEEHIAGAKPTIGRQSVWRSKQ